MSIWCSTSNVKCLDYGHSGVYPWETRLKESDSEVDFAFVADYVYDHDAVGEAIMPFLRMSVRNEKGEHVTVVLTEKGAQKVLRELTDWLGSEMRQPRRRKVTK